MNSNSGKLLIAIMLGTGVLAAGASWWFRYTATHRAAQFWGSQPATLIRDAPQVDLLALERTNGSDAKALFTVADVSWRVAASQDISDAHGLTHLRNALLEDRSFQWPAQAVPAQTEWFHGLRFRDAAAPPLVILFSSDFGLAVVCSPAATPSQAVSCEPIAAGLHEVFVEWAAATAEPSESPATSDQR